MPPPALTIRTAGPADLDAVAEIYAHYVHTSTATFDLTAPDRASWERRYRTIAEHGLPFLVGTLHGTIAGYACCALWKLTPPTGTPPRTPGTSRRGRPAAVGGVLLDELIARCAAVGLRELIAVVVDTGDPASVLLHPRPRVHRGWPAHRRAQHGEGTPRARRSLSW